MIIEVGKDKVAELIQGNFTFIDVGNGQTDSSVADTTLNNSILNSRKPASVNKIGNILVYTVDFTGAELQSNVISELGIFNNGTIGSGEMLSRVNFNSIGPLSADETISFTFRLTVI